MLPKQCLLLLGNNDYNGIFFKFLESFTTKFNWGYNDGYMNENIGQSGFLFSLFTLNKYGNEKKDINYYADLYFQAFPSFLDYIEPFSGNFHAFQIRFIERFCLWFGFATEEIIKKKNYFHREYKVMRTPVLEMLLM